MKPVSQISGTAAVLDIENIDTDQIIPAEHLKITNKSGLGEFLFSNWRYQPDGNKEQSFVLNKKETSESRVLIAGNNFGCGSSREHAPWALLDFGIQVVISHSIADIFRNNSIKNGLLPIEIGQQEHDFLLTCNSKKLLVDIEQQVIFVGEREIKFSIDPFTRYCFINGMDQLDFILSHEQAISKFEKQQKRYR